MLYSTTQKLPGSITKMTIEQLEQLDSEIKAKIAATKNSTNTATVLCSFIRKLEKKAQPQNQVYEEKRITYLNEAYNELKTHVLKVKTFLTQAPRHFHLENNENTHEGWRDVAFGEVKAKTKQANNLIEKIKHCKRKWQELNSLIEHLPESSQKKNLQAFLETTLPFADKLDELKIPLQFFGLRQKYYILMRALEEERITCKDAKKIIADSIEKLQNAREKIQNRNAIQQTDQLISRFQTLIASLPDTVSRQNSTNKQITFSSQNNSIVFIQRAYSLTSSQSTEIDETVPNTSSSSNGSIANNTNTLVGSQFDLSRVSSIENKKRRMSDSSDDHDKSFSHTVN